MAESDNLYLKASRNMPDTQMMLSRPVVQQMSKSSKWAKALIKRMPKKE